VPDAIRILRTLPILRRHRTPRSISPSILRLYTSYFVHQPLTPLFTSGNQHDKDWTRNVRLSIGPEFRRQAIPLHLPVTTIPTTLSTYLSSPTLYCDHVDITTRYPALSTRNDDSQAAGSFGSDPELARLQLRPQAGPLGPWRQPLQTPGHYTDRYASYGPWTRRCNTEVLPKRT
jgi:hypothetical protein